MGQPALHYLDDFLLIGASDSQQCVVALQTSRELCETLGVRIAAPKWRDPPQCFPSSVDSGNGVPSDKLLRLKRLIRLWRGKKKCKNRELLSQVGHACRVVRVGTFLRRMIDLSSGTESLGSPK